MHRNLLMFDFDGVICDSFAAAYSTCLHFFPDKTEADYKKMFEGNIYESADKARDLRSEAERTAHRKDWFDLYAPKILAAPLVPGIDAALHELAKDFRLVIVSSSIEGPLREYLALHGITHLFDSVLGADTHLSKVEKIGMTLERFTHAADESLFITDTLGDIREAAACAVRSLAVTWGFHDEATLRRGEPVGLVDEPTQLTAAVRELIGK